MGTELEFRLRAEACVLTAEALTNAQTQIQAGDQLHRLIHQMWEVDEPVDHPVQKFLPRIDLRRTNRVLLIDGSRGSGKTALLITLLHLWRRSIAGEPMGKLDEPFHRWVEPQGWIVPVGLLDLHPLPPSTNLLFHTIGRFERVVEWLEDDGTAEAEPAAWHFRGDRELESRKNWQKLLRAVAAGWDGNVKERAARLDLDAYAVELEEAERQRLNIVDTFTAFIDALVADFMKRRRVVKKPMPLFVIAVDDADMSVGRTVELLDTVRMLWHPRVAFILTGDSELFRRELVEHCLGNLEKSLREERVRKAGVDDGLFVTRTATEIYDKIIPIGHRCVLPPLPPAVRKEHLSADFRQIHIEPGATPGGPTLASYFDREPQLAEALPDRLRGLIELQEQVRVATSFDRAPVHAPASRLIKSIWTTSLRYHPELQQRFGEIVRVDDKTGALRIRFGTDQPGLDIAAPWVVARLARSAGEPQFQLSTLPRLDATSGRGVLLPEPVTAALMLASNVSSDQRARHWDGVETDLTGYECLFAASSFRATARTERLQFVWPLVRGYPVAFYAAFHSRWKGEISALLAQKSKTPRRSRRGPINAQPVVDREPPAALDLPRNPQELSRQDVDGAAQRFLRLVLYLLQTDTDQALESTELDWKLLAEGVAHIIEHGGVPLRRWALRRAGLLAAPEYGLSPEAANDWLDALIEAVLSRQIVSRSELCTALRTERRTNSGAPDARVPDSVLLEIDQACHDHRWASEIEAASTGPDQPSPGLPTRPVRRRAGG
jgi:hypothetical protein